MENSMTSLPAILKAVKKLSDVSTLRIKAVSSSCISIKYSINTTPKTVLTIKAHRILTPVNVNDGDYLRQVLAQITTIINDLPHSWHIFEDYAKWRLLYIDELQRAAAVTVLPEELKQTRADVLKKIFKAIVPIEERPWAATFSAVLTEKDTIILNGGYSQRISLDGDMIYRTSTIDLKIPYDARTDIMFYSNLLSILSQRVKLLDCNYEVDDLFDNWITDIEQGIYQYTNLRKGQISIPNLRV